MNHTETTTERVGARHPRKKAVSVQFDEKTLDKLRRKAAEAGLSLAAFLRIATLRMLSKGCKAPD